MRSSLCIALVGVLALTAGARAADETFDLLFELEPAYNVLNITGWSAYPDCWIFPQPAITLTSEGTTWQVAFTSSATDTSGGVEVATAWCKRWGFDGLGSFRQSDFSAGHVVRSISIGSGDTCAAAPGDCTAFKFIECIRGTALAGCASAQANVGIDNNGFGNNGSTNVGNFNDGSSNLGDFNLGSANVGSFNEGSAVVGNFQTCSGCVAPDLQQV